MKRFFCVLILFFVWTTPVAAANAEQSDTTTATSNIADIDTQDLLEGSGAGDITLPDGVSDFLNENNITVKEPSSILSITPKMVFAEIWRSLKEKLMEPLGMLAGLLAVILLCAVMESMGDTVCDAKTGKIFGIISILTCVGLLSTPLFGIMQKAADTLVAGGQFMLCYIPVFASIVAASGGITAAGGYNIIVMAVAEVFTQLANTILLPLLGFCLALGVVEAINPSISLSGLTTGIKKVATWGLGFIMTVFVGLLTIQSIVGTSVDTVAIKAGKFMVSSFVPVVGGALSDAYTTIRGSLGLLRGGVGSFGIIALVLTMLPTILSVAVLQLYICVGEIVAEIFGVKQLCGFLKNVSAVLAITMGLLLCFSIMLIISTTVIMLVGMNLG